LRKELSELSLRLKEILSGKEIEKSDIPDVEFFVKSSELFGEQIVSATRPLLTNLMTEVERYTGISSDSADELVENPIEFDELAEEVVQEFSSFDVDEARRNLRRSIASYIKQLQTIFLNFYPRLRLHSLYIDYLKKENERLRESTEYKNKLIKRLREEKKNLNKRLWDEREIFKEKLKQMKGQNKEKEKENGK